MDQESLKILQITDSHLFSSTLGKLLGMNTEDSFQAVLKLIREQHRESFDCILATGDLSQDGSTESYERFKQALTQFQCPQYWIPGNHDDRTLMQQVGGSACMPTLLDFPHWQIVLLDSQIPGEVHGNLTDSQLDIIDQALLSEPEKHRLLCLHHQPWPMGCTWLDSQQIISHQAFNHRVANNSCIKAVLWGHVHQASDRMFHDTRYVSTPSTCVQFKPESEDFCLDTLAPGYRWLTLHPDGSIETEVCRVEGQHFEVDWSQKGY